MILRIVLLLYAFGIRGIVAQRYDSITSSNPSSVSQCPGFCGRTTKAVANGTVYSACQGCPWGSRATHGGLCEECADDLPVYDWLYLLFVAILPLLTHCFFIRVYAREGSSWVHELVEHGCCIVECTVAAIGALLVMPPRWSFSLKGCRQSSVRAWYPAFYNPQVNFGRKLPCTYEVVFPLYSLPFIYFLLCLLCVLILRSTLYVTLRRKDRNCRAYYAALYSLPILAMVHALFAGVLYNTFAYVLVLWSVAANAVHLSLEGNKSLRVMLKLLLSSGKHITLLVVNMALLAFAIVSLAVDRQDYWAFGGLLLVPLPPLFYLMTIGLSHPSTVNAT